MESHSSSCSQIVEWLIDPQTFHTVWLGIWSASETVTTVADVRAETTRTSDPVRSHSFSVHARNMLGVIESPG